MDKTVRIGWMDPDCLNLHGERGSVQAFERIGEEMGLDVQVERIEDFDFPAFLARYEGKETLFAVRLKETGRLIGILTLFDEDGGACEIGYGLGSRHWGRGYATEAVARFLEYLFDERGFTSVEASYFTGNDASRRVMEKCGMAFSRFAEKDVFYLGEDRDLTYYSISRE